jgi:hypothetical protein
MAIDEFENPATSPEPGMNRKRMFVGFLIGLAVGIAGTLLAPRFLGPYLPAGIVEQAAPVEGVVTAKREVDQRLLLTVVTPAGATLATFTERVDEISLLVDKGDTVSLALSRYEPFVTDPRIRGVQKQRPGAEGESGARPPGTGEGTPATGEGTPAGGEEEGADRMPAETPEARDTADTYD